MICIYYIIFISYSHQMKHKITIFCANPCFPPFFNLHILILCFTLKYINPIYFLNINVTLPRTQFPNTTRFCFIYITLREKCNLYTGRGKVIMQGKLFQRCTLFLYCSVLSLGGNVNTRRMSQPDLGSIFHIKNH